MCGWRLRPFLLTPAQKDAFAVLLGPCYPNGSPGEQRSRAHLRQRPALVQAVRSCTADTHSELPVRCQAARGG